MRRERKMPAPQAEAAFVAAGARRWDEGPVRIDLPARILNFRPGRRSTTRRNGRIHGEIVTHIGALNGKLKRAGDAEWDARRKEIGADLR